MQNACTTNHYTAHYKEVFGTPNASELYSGHIDYSKMDEKLR